MFSEGDVKALLRDRRLRPPVASLYLNTDRTHAEGEKYLAAFRHVVHEADRLLARATDATSAVARERLVDAVPLLLAFLDHQVARKPVVRGVALFVSFAARSGSNPKAPPFAAYPLPRPVRSQARVEQHPYVRPLLLLLDQYERVGVITADRNHARILTLFLGELEEIVHRHADTPHRHAQGGWKQMLFQRDVDGHIKAHVRATVRDALRLFRTRPLKRLILGGSDETLALLKADLPSRFRPLLAGTFLAEPHASDREIVSKALTLAHAAERAEEAQRVRELQEALARRPGDPWATAHHRAVHGVPDTLRALTERRVQRLLVRRGFRAPGSICDNCGTLSAQNPALCASCGTPSRPVADIVEHAVERAADEHAEVEFVMEDHTLETLGSIGAMLRF